ncbi:MAG: anthranilate synthase component I [Rhodomicrobium sp.]|jgi:anthranilate synthase component 1
MKVEPSSAEFTALYDAGEAQLVSTRLVADLETPVAAMLKLGAGRPYSFLLESVEGGAVRGRYSIIGLDPDILWRAHGDRAEIDKAPLQDASAFEPCEGGTLAALRALLKESRLDIPHHLPPMAAGVFGYLGYDTVRLVERLPAEKPDPIGVPDALLMRPTIMVIFDAVKDEMTLVTTVRPDKRVPANAAYSRAIDRLTEVQETLENKSAHASSANGFDASFAGAVSNMAPEDYMAMVARAKEYIGAGDIFQVVLSQRFASKFDLPPFALYRALRRVNPAPFLYFLNFGNFAVAGSSPEILVRVREGEVTIRPIAGTRRRGATPEEDKGLAAELLADTKERAEHLMLLDLGRNDVGRVAEIGSVRVTDSFFLEYYSQVMHIVSNVAGRLDAKHDSIDALMAGFPAGTVSGAPKVRAMEIIDELEPEKRGVYAGCIGYFAANGEMDTCIALRTAIVKDGAMYVQAGAGIVADSVPASEQAECESKARALFRAAEEAVRFAGQAGRGQ